MSQNLGFYFMPTEPLLRDLEWVNNKFQLLWRAGTAEQKDSIGPVMAEWWEFYRRTKESFFIFTPATDWKIRKWDVVAGKIRQQFEREGTDVSSVPGGGPADGLADSLVKIAKWGAIVSLAYISYNIYKNIRTDWKEHKAARGTAGLGYTCARRSGKLTTEKRRRIPARDYGLPKQRKYPMPDVSHAINAKGRATTALRKKQITRSEYNQIVRKANKIIEACRGKRAA